MKFIKDLCEMNDKRNIWRSPWWFVKVSCEDGLLERSDIEVEHIEPLFVKTDLVHVNISRRHSFIAAFQPLILKDTSIKS